MVRLADDPHRRSYLRHQKVCDSVVDADAGVGVASVLYPSSVSKTALPSRRDASTEFANFVLGSYLLPMTRIGFAVVAVHGPVNRSELRACQETVALLIPALANGTPVTLAPGKYTLHLDLSRNLWRDANSTNPESIYAQQQTLELTW